MSALEISVAVLGKLGSNLLEDPAIPLLDIYPKGAYSHHMDTCSTMFIAGLFILSRTWEQYRCPSTKKWIRKV